MYTKRKFQWKMDRYSYYNMIQVCITLFMSLTIMSTWFSFGIDVTCQDLVCDLGTFIFVPIFHHFNVNDNIIIMRST